MPVEASAFLLKSATKMADFWEVGLKPTPATLSVKVSVKLSAPGTREFSRMLKEYSGEAPEFG
jgi:hypothetical protein